MPATLADCDPGRVSDGRVASAISSAHCRDSTLSQQPLLPRHCTPRRPGGAGDGTWSAASTPLKATESFGPRAGTSSYGTEQTEIDAHGDAPPRTSSATIAAARPVDPYSDHGLAARHSQARRERHQMAQAPLRRTHFDGDTR